MGMCSPHRNDKRSLGRDWPGRQCSEALGPELRKHRGGAKIVSPWRKQAI